ncbi:MAG: flagellar brake protein [bacterium]
MLPIGTVIQLVDPVNKVKLSSRLIGWREGDCMMLEQPIRINQAVQLQPKLPIVGRGVHEGRIWGFRSSVIVQLVQPFRILFLHYPKHIEEITLRKTERIQLKVDVVLMGRKHNFEEIRNDPTAPRGCMQNLSKGGCKLSCPFRFEVNMPVFLSFELPNGKVVENLMGFVRNVVREQNENIYGVQFDERNTGLEEYLEFVDLAAKLLSKGAVSA